MHGKFDDLGRFADPSLLILTSLADGAKHGYAIMTDVTAFSGVSMEIAGPPTAGDTLVLWRPR